jgi:hypothetical protein
MPWMTGVAEQPGDLLEKVKTYLSDTTVLGAQAWEIKKYKNGELLLLGHGLTGKDNIYVGLKLCGDPVTQIFYLDCQGFTGLDDKLEFSKQPGAVNGRNPKLPLWNKPMTFWLVANGRRFILAVKVSNRYEALYLGFILPYATESQFPYPLAVGGSITGHPSSAFQYSYTVNSLNHSCFIDPVEFAWTRNDTGKFESSSEQCSELETQLRLRTPDGRWVGFANGSSVQWEEIDRTYAVMGNYTQKGSTFPYCIGVTCLTKNVDGTYPLFSILLFDKTPNLFGELDGCYYIPGFEQSPESLVSVENTSYLVLPNSYRVNRDSFWALKLS